MIKNTYGWDNDNDNPMRINITCNGGVVMHFFLGEAMENAGRNEVMSHVRECDSSPWLGVWYDLAVEATFGALKS